MATSGSVDYTLTAGEIVESAFSKIGVKAAEQPLQASEMTDGLRVLNLTLKLMQAQGLHLWLREEGVLFLTPGTTDYLVGPTGSQATTLDDFVSTAITADLVSTTTIIPVTDSTGMSNGDFVGIKLDDGTRQWTTIVTVDSSTQITITDGLTYAASSGNSVFTYTSIIQRPLRITSFRRKTFNVDNEIPVISWSRDEYFNQTNKESQGSVVNAYYSPLLGNGRIYVWQTASSVDDYLRFSFQRPIEDIDNKVNNLDVPVEWLEPIIYGVAVRLIDDYYTPPEISNNILLKYNAMMEEVLGWDQEYESINLQPDND